MALLWPKDSSNLESSCTVWGNLSSWHRRGYCSQRQDLDFHGDIDLWQLSYQGRWPSGEEVLPEWSGRNSNLEKTLKKCKGMEPIFRKLPDCWEITSDFKQRDLNSQIAVALPCWRMNISSCLFCMRKLCQPFEAVWPLLGLVFRHILKRKPRWLMSHVCLLCIPMFRYLPRQGTVQFPFPQIPSILLMWKGDNCWDKKVWRIYSI